MIVFRLLLFLKKVFCFQVLYNYLMIPFSNFLSYSLLVFLICRLLLKFCFIILNLLYFYVSCDFFFFSFPSILCLSQCYFVLRILPFFYFICFPIFLFYPLLGRIFICTNLFESFFSGSFIHHFGFTIKTTNDVFSICYKINM